MSIPELSLGELPLHPGYASNAADWRLEVSADGTEWGNPQAVVEVINSLLRDGSLARLTRHDNRTAVIQVRVSADSYDGLAAAEEALMAEVNRGRNVLRWLPPVPDAVQTVFTVLVSSLEFNFDDVEERRLRRYYTLTLTCAPFAQSADVTVEQAVPVPPAPGAETTVTIDSAGSTSGWSTKSSANLSDTLTVQSDSHGTYISRSFPAVYQSPTWPVYFKVSRLWLTPVTLTQPYLRCDVMRVEPVTFTGFWINKQPARIVGYELVGAVSRYYLDISGITGLLHLEFEAKTSAGGGELRIYDVSETDALPRFGSLKQRSFSLPVGGSVRTPAKLRVYCTSGSLGDRVMIYTRPNSDVTTPPLRPYLVSSALVTADTDAVSGAVNSIETPDEAVFRMPVSRVEPGTYALMARLYAVAPTLVSWSFRMTKPDGTPFGGQLNGIANVDIVNWDIVDLGRVTLPVVQVPQDSSLQMELQLVAMDSMVLDEAWLFNLDAGSLSWVATTTPAGGDPITEVIVQPPTVDNPIPAYFASPSHTDPTVRYAHNGFVRSWGLHEFPPGVVDVFTVATGSDDARVEIEYVKQWHTHARD